MSDMVFDHAFAGYDLRHCEVCGEAAGDHQDSVPDRVFPIAGLMTRYTTQIAVTNDVSVQPDGTRKWFDTLSVYNDDGEEVDSVSVETSEDEQPYKQALLDAGWIIVGVVGMTGDWRVRRA